MESTEVVSQLKQELKVSHERSQLTQNVITGYTDCMQNSRARQQIA